MQVKFSDKFRASYDKFNVSKEELSQFLSFKRNNPIARYGGKDYPYTGGALADTGARHAHIRSDLIIVYFVEGKNPTIIKLCCYTTHEESGTGTPKKPNKQNAFAKYINGMTYK